jgi:hypothetical protein
MPLIKISFVPLPVQPVGEGKDIRMAFLICILYFYQLKV